MDGQLPSCYFMLSTFKCCKLNSLSVDLVAIAQVAQCDEDIKYSKPKPLPRLISICCRIKWYIKSM